MAHAPGSDDESQVWGAIKGEPGKDWGCHQLNHHHYGHHDHHDHQSRSFWYQYDYEHHQYHHQAQERAAMRDAIRATSSGPSSAARLSLVIIGMVIMGYHRLSSFWSSLWSSVIIGYHLWSSVITFMITIFTIVITNTIMTNITVITISSQIM